MAKGMDGFEHNCNATKTKYKDYKKSLNDSSYTETEKLIIWDFYVSHNLAGGCGLQRSFTDYGWTNASNKEKFLKEMESNLMHIAGIDKLCCIRSKKIDNTLKACDLYENEICVEHPRAVIQRKFTLEIDENEKISFAGGQGGEKRIDCLFRHIRNSFAHTNTYFFNNGNVLLEDKDGTKITSMILIKGQTLLDWIHYIDKDNRFYSEGDL